MITLRLATLNDIPAIQEVSEKTWPVSYKEIITSEQIRYMLDRMYSTSNIEQSILDPNQAFWLTEKDGKTIGFCGIEHHYPEARFTRIHKLYVLPDTQGMGAGKILLRHIEKEALLRGNTHLHLNVNKRNKAVDFYRKHGFSIACEEVLDIGNGFVMDDFVMTKTFE
ncbi:GNAT family N-acetyltransferase [Fluviicola sp.]|jgi:ribosomal protein S18 acetylase RimI-like enzyme|uniref:GNAT family N-acetyltransferase n=1 Tax=Fluviicola sp. TaxID=1917219 RepID=UPI002819DDEB|nr:GNAT family N-acetyltransferase [Fluviicola sp.]MDR0802775.1 GNAT family N-acetyltransferase [Fluviicola sp.]